MLVLFISNISGEVNALPFWSGVLWVHGAQSLAFCGVLWVHGAQSLAFCGVLWVHGGQSLAFCGVLWVHGVNL